MKLTKFQQQMLSELLSISIAKDFTDYHISASPDGDILLSRNTYDTVNTIIICDKETVGLSIIPKKGNGREMEFLGVDKTLEELFLKFIKL